MSRATDVSVPARAEVADPGVSSRLAGLWLELAEESRQGLPSSLFSQSGASESPDVVGGRRDRPSRSESNAATGDGGSPSGVAGATTEAQSPGPLAASDGVEVVLEPDRQDSDAERIADESGLEVTSTRRQDDGSLVATVKAPEGADPGQARRALETLEAAPGVVETRPLPSGGEGSSSAAAPRSERADSPEAQELIRELLGDSTSSALGGDVGGAGFPWRFVLGMLGSLALLAAGIVLFLSSRES